MNSIRGPEGGLTVHDDLLEAVRAVGVLRGVQSDGILSVLDGLAAGTDAAVRDVVGSCEKHNRVRTQVGRR